MLDFFDRLKGYAYAYPFGLLGSPAESMEAPSKKLFLYASNKANR